ncbi:MAG: glycosyltransferase family 4 protein [Candidatus Micrarchaeia archaeon]
MRVCILNPFPLSYKGGVESVLNSLNSELQRRGIETIVVTLSENEMRFVPHFARIVISGILLKKLFKLKNRFDLIHANAWSACILKFIKNKPSVATAHGTVRGLISSTSDLIPLHSQLYTSLITQNLERIGFRNACRVVAVSNSCRTELVADYHVAEEKVDVIYNGIDLRKVKRIKTNLKDEFGCENLLLFVGRLTKQKGLEFLIKAIPLLKDYDVKLAVIGEGPERKNLAHLASKLGVREKVVFFGGVDEGKKLELLSASDVFVCPSLWESFGIVLLEAMACKTPIVASNVASIPEVVGECGVLVEPRNSKAISEGVTQLLDDKKTARELAQKAYRRVKRSFTIQKTADGYAKLYGRLFNHSKS